MKHTHLVRGTLAAILAVGWLGTASAADPIRLGVAVPLSGEFRTFGLSTQHAAEFVVKEVNARGGVLGRPVELLVEDDGCKPESAANVAAKFVTNKVDVVLGHICNRATKAGLEAYRSANIIAMSPSATNPSLTQSGEYPNFYRTNAADDTQAKVVVDFAITKLKAKKIALLCDKRAPSQAFTEFAKGIIEKSGKVEVAVYDEIATGTADYSAIAQKVKQKGADGLIYGGSDLEAAKIVVQMRKKKMKTSFITNDGAKSLNFLKEAGADAEGTYASGPKDTSKLALTIKANEEYRAAHGADPGAFYLNAYAAALALLNAIEKAGSTEYAALEKALRSQWVETPLGKISFDERGEAIGVGFAMYRVEKGKYTEVVAK